MENDRWVVGDTFGCKMPADAARLLMLTNFLHLWQVSDFGELIG